MAEDVLLQMTDITKVFPGVKALDKVSLTVRRGTVHALMGENGAGKSTLMKCLFGIYSRDSGEIELEGKPINFKSSKEALENGVAMVHQELNQALKRSVMDNLWLGRYPKVGGIAVDERKMYKDTVEIFKNLGIEIEPRRIMSAMPVSQRQMVEIAKAVSYNSKVIVFDEPTSSLTETEVEHLFRIINMLRDKGCGIIYISHKMDEILRISDDVTIMRDGQYVATKAAKDLTKEEIIKLMVGRELNNQFPPRPIRPGQNICGWKTSPGSITVCGTCPLPPDGARCWAWPVWTAPGEPKRLRASSASAPARMGLSPWTASAARTATPGSPSRRGLPSSPRNAGPRVSSPF